MLVKPRVIRETSEDDVIDGPWGPEIRKEFHSINNRIGRKERITEYVGNGKNPYLVKECSVGTIDSFMFGKDLSTHVDTFSYATIDINSGELIQFGCECEWPNPDSSYGQSNVFAGAMETFYPPHVPLSGKRQLNPYLEMKAYKTVEDVHSEIDYYENELQISYIDLIGLVSAFFSKWNYAYPFESLVHINSHAKKFNIPKFVYRAGIPDVAGRKLYYRFIKDLDDLCEVVNNVCEKEHKQVVINAFVGVFGSVVNVHDLKKKANYILPINGSDHLQNVIRNVSVYNLKYISSESLGLLCKGAMPEVTMECVDACNGFV